MPLATDSPRRLGASRAGEADPFSASRTTKQVALQRYIILGGMQRSRFGQTEVAAVPIMGREQVAAPTEAAWRHLVAVHPVRVVSPGRGRLATRAWCLRKLQVDETQSDVAAEDRALAVLRLQECLGKVSRRETSQTTSPEGFLRQDGWVRLLGYTRISTAS